MTEASTSYCPPTKYILSPAHLAAFRRSKTHGEITQFITDLNESIVGKTLTKIGEGSEVCIAP
jgi:serine/threonine-protein phosphatase 2A activator